MYCEIDIEHSASLQSAELISAIRPPALGTEMPLTDAYHMSRRYNFSPPATSLFAQFTVRNCFVIARSVAASISTYHLEGQTRTVSVKSLLEASEIFTKQILAKINSDKRTAGKLLVIRLFEDSGNETGVEGQGLTLKEALLEQLSWKQLAPKVLAAVTAVPIIYLRLDKRSLLWSSIISLAIFVLFGLVEAALNYFRNRRKIKFVVSGR